MHEAGLPHRRPKIPIFFLHFSSDPFPIFLLIRTKKILQILKNQFYVGFRVPLDSVRVQERDEGALHHPLDGGRDWPEGFHYFPFFLEKYFVAYRKKEIIKASYKADVFECFISSLM
jgi:hypothetical protein